MYFHYNWRCNILARACTIYVLRWCDIRVGTFSSRVAHYDHLMSAPMEDDDTEFWLCPDCMERHENETTSPEEPVLSEDRMREHKRMQNSCFWLFFWNNVYNNETDQITPTPSRQNILRGKAVSSGARGGFAVPVQDKVALELIAKFEHVRIALIARSDVDKATQQLGIKYQESLIFENEPAIEWTVERCKIFQDVLVEDCEKNKRRTRPLIVPAQHYVLKLPEDFKSGEYSIGVVEYDETLEYTRGMFFTARDVDAEHVFEASVLDHQGWEWQWDETAGKKMFADAHGFQRLVDGKFMCEKEPNKALHEQETEPDEFGRNTVWIEMPSDASGPTGVAGPPTIGELGGIIAAASSTGYLGEKRVNDGCIVALGFELQTQDNRAVQVYSRKP